MRDNPLYEAMKEWLELYRTAEGMAPSRARYRVQLEMYSLEFLLKNPQGKQRGMQQNLSYITGNTALSLLRLGWWGTIVVSDPLITSDEHGELNTFTTKVMLWTFRRSRRVVRF